MSGIQTTITLSNIVDPSTTRDITAFADEGVLHTRLPLALANELGLVTTGRRRITHEGQTAVWPYGGAILVTVGDRQSVGGVVIGGEHIVLGRMALSDMHLCVDETLGQLVAQPMPAKIKRVEGA